MVRLMNQWWLEHKLPTLTRFRGRLEDDIVLVKTRTMNY